MNFFEIKKKKSTFKCIQREQWILFHDFPDVGSAHLEIQAGESVLQAAYNNPDTKMEILCSDRLADADCR